MSSYLKHVGSSAWHYPWCLLTWNIDSSACHVPCGLLTWSMGVTVDAMILGISLLGEQIEVMMLRICPGDTAACFFEMSQCSGISLLTTLKNCLLFPCFLIRVTLQTYIVAVSPCFQAPLEWMPVPDQVSLLSPAPRGSDMTSPSTPSFSYCQGNMVGTLGLALVPIVPHFSFHPPYF